MSNEKSTNSDTSSSSESSYENGVNDKCEQTNSDRNSCSSDELKTLNKRKTQKRKLSVNSTRKGGDRKRIKNVSKVIKLAEYNHKDTSCDKSKTTKYVEQGQQLESLKIKIKDLERVNKQITNERNNAVKQLLISHKSNKKQISMEEHISQLEKNMLQIKQLMEKTFKQYFENKVTVQKFSMKCVPGNINPYFDMHHSLTPDLRKLVCIENIFAKAIKPYLHKFHILLHQCIGDFSLSTHDSSIFNNLKLFCNNYSSLSLKYVNHDSRSLKKSINEKLFDNKIDATLLNTNQNKYSSHERMDFQQVYEEFKKIIITIVVEAISVIDYVYTNRSLKSKKIKMSVSNSPSKEVQRQNNIYCSREFASDGNDANNEIKVNEYKNNMPYNDVHEMGNNCSATLEESNICSEDITTKKMSDFEMRQQITPLNCSKIILLDEVRFLGLDADLNQKLWPIENEDNVELIYTDFRPYINLAVNNNENDHSDDLNKTLSNGERQFAPSNCAPNTYNDDGSKEQIIRGKLFLHIEENYVFQILANPFWIPPVNHVHDASLNGLGTLNNVRMNNRYLYILRYVLHSMVHIFASMHPAVFNHSLQHPIHNDVYIQINNKFEPFFIRNETF